jgi:hypothetical protein
MADGHQIGIARSLTTKSGSIAARMACSSIAASRKLGDLHTF